MIFYLISVLESSSSDQHSKAVAGRVGSGNHGNTGYSSGNESADASLGEVYIIDGYHVIWNVHTESDGGEGLGLRTPNLSDVIYEYSNITLLLVICLSFESSNKVTHITPKIILLHNMISIYCILHNLTPHLKSPVSQSSTDSEPDFTTNPKITLSDTSEARSWKTVGIRRFPNVKSRVLTLMEHPEIPAIKQVYHSQSC